jgi:hypothetical protein
MSRDVDEDESVKSFIETRAASLYLISSESSCSGALYQVFVMCECGGHQGGRTILNKMLENQCYKVMLALVGVNYPQVLLGQYYRYPWRPLFQPRLALYMKCAVWEYNCVR